MLLCGGGAHGIAVIGQHISPIVIRLAKVGTFGSLVVGNGIFMLAKAVCRPLVVIHHLCHGSGHATAVWIPRLSIEGVRLSPLGFEQRLHCLAESCCARAGLRSHLFALNVIVCLSVPL